MRATVPWKSFLAALFLLSGCAVQWVSAYDEVTDRDATALLRATEAHLARLQQEEGQPGAVYDHHKEFYADAHAAIAVLSARAKGMEDNSITVRQLEELAEQYRKFEALHRSGPLGGTEIQIVRNQVEAGLGAVIAFELAKKRGK